MQQRFLFSRDKFLSLPSAQQHKKCAELLKATFPSSHHPLLDTYSLWCQWIDHPPITTPSAETISDRYHDHCRHAGIDHKECGLLPNIRQGDRLEGAPSLPIAIYLDNIRSAHNIGSIIRTIEAFSLGTLHLAPSMAGPENKKVIDTAMGAEEWVTVTTTDTFSDLPRPIIALETSPNATPLSEFSFPNSFTLAVGNEEYGCSTALLQAADHIIEIPLCGRKNSLNVANAFAIAAAEINRQQRTLVTQ